MQWFCCLKKDSSALNAAWTLLMNGACLQLQHALLLSPILLLLFNVEMFSHTKHIVMSTAVLLKESCRVLSVGVGGVQMQNVTAISSPESQPEVSWSRPPRFNHTMISGLTLVSLSNTGEMASLPSMLPYVHTMVIHNDAEPRFISWYAQSDFLSIFKNSSPEFCDDTPDHQTLQNW